MSSLLSGLYDHLVLPPQIPGTADLNADALARDLIFRMTRACDSLLTFGLPPDVEKALTGLKLSLESCSQIHKTGQLESSLLCSHLRKFTHGHVLIIHLGEQNTALLIRRTFKDGTPDGVIFEHFEASPSSEAVLEAPSHLVWDFPGHCAKITDADFDDPDFQQSLAAFLQDASAEALHSLRATVIKAGVSVAEVRDTTNPSLVTNMLIPVLEAIGSSVTVPLLRKRVRDDVNLDTGPVPWRRLPMWLVLRVAAQRHLGIELEDSGHPRQGRVCYKFLVALLLADFLGDCTTTFNAHQIRLLYAKVSRRMAKMEMAREAAKGSERRLYDQLFTTVGPIVQDKIRRARSVVEAFWTGYRQSSLLRIPHLPRRAPDEALRLGLSQSGHVLEHLLTAVPALDAVQQTTMPAESTTSVQSFRQLTSPVYEAVAYDHRLSRSRWTVSDDPQACRTDCLNFAKDISGLCIHLQSLGYCDAEQFSPLILTMFELWSRMDQCAATLCPLILDYSPFFTTEMLDSLQLLEPADLNRLRIVQRYIQKRREVSKRHETLFSNLDTESFASEYTAMSTSLQELELKIQRASDSARQLTIEKWQEACAEYDRLTALWLDGTCICTYDEDGKRIIDGCERCYHYRLRNRLLVPIHEDFLPGDDAQRAAAVFELGMEEYFREYRDTTWLLVKRLLHPSRPGSTRPMTTIDKCDRLNRFLRCTRPSVTLGSRVKLFTQTHYRFAGHNAKPDLSSIFVPCGASFRLFDKADNIWVSDMTGPLTLQHLCHVFVPASLRRASVLSVAAHPDAEIKTPSSYQIAANQTKCPNTMSAQEF